MGTCINCGRPTPGSEKLCEGAVIEDDVFKSSCSVSFAHWVKRLYPPTSSAPSADQELVLLDQWLEDGAKRKTILLLDTTKKELATAHCRTLVVDSFPTVNIVNDTVWSVFIEQKKPERPRSRNPFLKKDAHLVQRKRR